jgi:hypothetical protein
MISSALTTWVIYRGLADLDSPPKSFGSEILTLTPLAAGFCEEDFSLPVCFQYFAGK